MIKAKLILLTKSKFASPNFLSQYAGKQHLPFKMDHNAMFEGRGLTGK